MWTTIGILGLVLGLAVLIFLGFRGWGMAPYVIGSCISSSINKQNGFMGSNQRSLWNIYEKLCR